MSPATHHSVDAALPAVADPDRLAAVTRTGLLDGGDDVLDRLARLASALVQAPRAFVTMVTPERQHLPGMVRWDDPGDESRTTPLSSSLCQFTVATGAPLLIPDSHQDSLVRDMPIVRTGEVGAYIGVPLRAEHEHVLGTLCVLDTEPRQWAEHELALLEDLAALATREIERRLTVPRGEQWRRLAEQVAQHVAPLADVVDSLAGLTERADDARLQRYAGLARRRLEPLVAATEQLREVSQGRPRPPQDAVRADLRDAVGRAVHSARAATGSDLIELESGRSLPVECDGLPIEQAVTHLFVTALHHSDAAAPVVVRLDEAEPETPRTTTGRYGVLTVLAPDCRVPAGELARVVSRFHAASCESVDTGEEGGPAALRVVGGAVTAESGPVRGRSSRDGLLLTAQWPLATG